MSEDSPAVISPPPPSKPEKANKNINRYLGNFFIFLEFWGNCPLGGGIHDYTVAGTPEQCGFAFPDIQLKPELPAKVSEDHQLFSHALNALRYDKHVVSKTKTPQSLGLCPAEHNPVFTPLQPAN
ncbi:hypothetical protein AVEN_108074-1 [Araneus ventricosus]|uniref:Uncharacterized protein n=1 Tax=Araneus ventricosus TaxID=182803 RepID=A0A4Y2KB03_ARAVE|nr:hypothetical protein AVEN_108074-1 [Araneus ventricosus]